MLQRALERGQVKSLLVGDDSVEISHLLFANDTVLFLPKDKANFVNALTMIQLFQGISSLDTNLGKKGLVGINIVDHVLQDLVEVARCCTLNWPIMYLGVPLGGNPCVDSFKDPILKKIAKCLDKQKGAFFSLGGQVTFIQACLSSVPHYYFQLF